jgi:hypothetical protein
MDYTGIKMRLFQAEWKILAALSFCCFVKSLKSCLLFGPSLESGKWRIGSGAAAGIEMLMCVEQNSYIPVSRFHGYVQSRTSVLECRQ